jgi:hypothetical protein
VQQRPPKPQACGDFRPYFQFPLFCSPGLN